MRALQREYVPGRSRALLRAARCLWSVLWGVAAVSCGSPSGMAADEAATEAVAEHPSQISFARDIRPILARHCWSCHGPDEAAREADLRLDLRESATRPRSAGGAPIVPGRPGQSRVIARVETEDEGLVMPPPDAKKPLSPRQRQLLRAWIAQGADYAPHWAFVPPRRPARPESRRPDWIRNPIDEFIVARLNKEGWEPAEEAARETLLRRVTFDLTGLPPSVSELEDFLSDRSESAYEKVVDRLLNSPRHAERLAMHWLDVARYADTNGYNNDEERTMWPWRDWVIDAFRRNLPYDRFVIEQLAGDLLSEPTLAQRVATGFNRNHVLTTEGGIIEEEYRVEYVADRVHTTATVFLGLSLQCARCHDHKYDPFTQREYYQVFAYFNHLPDQGVGYNKGGFAPPYARVPDPQQQSALHELDEGQRAAEAAIAQRTTHARRLAAEWELGLSAEDRQRLADSAPVLHVRLDEWSGQIADSQSAATPAGVIQGPAAWTAGRLGGALEFAGNTSIDFGQAFSFDAVRPFSVSAWVYRASDEPATIIAKMDEEHGYRGFDLILEGGKIACHLVDHWPENGVKVISREPLKPNEWHHVGLTYSGSRQAAGVSLYVDGKLQAVDVAGDTLQGTTHTEQPVRVGRRSASAPFRGRLDDLQVYGVELGAEDMARLASGGSPSPIAELLAVARDRRSAEQTQDIETYYLERVDAEFRRGKAELAELPARRAALDREIPGVMVMQELPAPRTTHVLRRGQYDALGEVVTAGVPAALPPLSADAPANRLGFALWLTRPSHPLTARVAVNRWWEMLFGTGLVETVEDFGVTGALPTHPELLDWLAVEFSSPRVGWDVRSLLWWIVTSATYRQSSAVHPESQARDPRNLLLGRAPRFRLPAESVRDMALELGGLLVERPGGPSVKPYQPEGLWEDVSVERREKYRIDPGEGLYRRSMYTFWKRTCPPPALSVFDAPTRETCTIRRARTNTPLQALVLLNDPTYLEAARKMAERILSETAAPDARLSAAFRMAVAREPDAGERQSLQSLQRQALDGFRRDPPAARELLSVGRAPADGRHDPLELASWAVVCTTLLNLDETISRE